ncbi:MAG: peptide chain release factor N(5)-glutamine methyltransferase [Lachnospiraceae bacterium]|nr:peptide chain release factor N(5)-glutamine methyltransferase [Lachnospiraceae bacterium]
MKYREIYELGSLKLKAAGIEEYNLDARLLLEHVLNTTATTLFSDPDMMVDEEGEKTYLALIDERAKHVPLQHITKKQWFMGLEFNVSKDVLIPRQDTECLVELVQGELHDGMKILDMCTGSGCILLSLLKYSNDCVGVGADISDKALKIAYKNAVDLGMEEKLSDESLRFIQGNLFENVNETFDIIVSNPPYIVTCEIESLMPEVKDHEPFIALNGKEDGLYFYNEIVKVADKYLNKGGFIAFEIGNTQGMEVSKLLKDAGFIDVKVTKDLCGNDRVVSARRSVL